MYCNVQYKVNYSSIHVFNAVTFYVTSNKNLFYKINERARNLHSIDVVVAYKVRFVDNKRVSFYKIEMLINCFVSLSQSTLN